MARIPDGVWEKDQRHHRKIFEAAGKCALCHERVRDVVCSTCGEPLCAVCMKSHGLREAYIEKLALSMPDFHLERPVAPLQASGMWWTAVDSEREEARALVARREMEAEEVAEFEESAVPKVRAAGA